MTGNVSEPSSLASFFASASEDRETQYRAALEAAALFDRSHLGRIAVLGADGEAFLQNMLSADVKKLPRGSGAEATFLTNKGKLVSNLTVLKLADRILLEMESTRIAPLSQALSRYVISEDVTLEDRTPVETSFSIEGARATGVLSASADVPEPEIAALEHLETLEHEGLSITPRRRDPSSRYDIATSPGRALTILEAARDAGAVVADATVAEVRRIEAGRPRFGVDIDDRHMPLEAGLDDAISFDKGCYIGQEYVVRLAHRGHVNRKLVGIRIECREPPPPGATITAGDEDAGTITSAAFSPTLAAVVALGFLRRGFFDPGTHVTVEGGLPGMVTKLPFV